MVGLGAAACLAGSCLLGTGAIAEHGGLQSIGGLALVITGVVVALTFALMTGLERVGALADADAQADRSATLRFAGTIFAVLALSSALLALCVVCLLVAGGTDGAQILNTVRGSWPFIDIHAVWPYVQALPLGMVFGAGFGLAAVELLGTRLPGFEATQLRFGGMLVGALAAGTVLIVLGLALLISWNATYGRM
jgi:hypothetical protein